MLIICQQVCACKFSHHVLQVNEGVIDGHNLDAFLKASPQDQTANTTEAAEWGGREKEREINIVAWGKWWETSSGCQTTPGNSHESSNKASNCDAAWIQHSELPPKQTHFHSKITQNHPVYKMCVFQTHPLIPTQRSDMSAVAWRGLSYLGENRETSDIRKTTTATEWQK